jgi:RNA polymerase sigma-70 factor (ECF subfamily)
VSVTGSSALDEAALGAARDRLPTAEALHATLVREYPGLVRVLVDRVGDRSVALDVLQDAVATTLTKLAGDSPPEPAHVAGFVFRTALNHLRNHRRHTRTWRSDPDALETCVADGPSPLEASAAEANARLVRQVLAGLGSPRDREVLVRFYLDEQDKDEICAALGLTALQFNQVIFRARERMRRGLERAGMVRWDLAMVWVTVALPVLAQLSGACA